LVFWEIRQQIYPNQLGNFSELHQPWSMNELVTTRRATFEVQCNWKAFLDVFNEYYHLNNVHPTSIDNLYNKPEEADKTTGDFASQFGFTTGTGALLEADQINALPIMENLEAPLEPWSKIQLDLSKYDFCSKSRSNLGL